MYIPLGALVVAKRLWDSQTTARYERFIRAAEAAGNHEGRWSGRTGGRVHQGPPPAPGRHDRVPSSVLLAVPKIALGMFVVLAVLGTFLAIGTKHIAEVAAPFKAVADIVEWIAIAFSVAWGPLLLALPWIALGALWWAGRAHANANMTGWLSPAKKDDDTGPRGHGRHDRPGPAEPADPGAAPAFKDGWRPTFHTLPVRDGRGYSAVFSLPLGVTAEMIADQRPVLARNVHRAEVEVWPSDAEQAGPARPGPSRCGSPTRASCPRPPGVPADARGHRRRVRRACPAASRRAATRSRSRSSATTSCPAARWGRARATPAG